MKYVILGIKGANSPSPIISLMISTKCKIHNCAIIRRLPAGISRLSFQIYDTFALCKNLLSHFQINICVNDYRYKIQIEFYPVSF